MKSDNFKILGLEFNKKQTLISLAVALGVFIVLLILNLCGVRISWYGVLIALGFMLALRFNLVGFPILNCWCKALLCYL